MNENEKNMAQDWVDPDEIPDLSASEWQEVIDATPVRPGRPTKTNPKISTTIRLDPDLLEALRATGKGWQTRANEFLRKGMGM